MKKSADTTWTLLLENGIVEGKEPANGTADSPWYIKLLLAFSGWLAAIFLLCFVGAAFTIVFDNSTVAAIVGLMMISIAFGLLRSSGNEFVEHLGLATSLAGQALIIYAIFDNSGSSDVTPWLLLAFLEALLLALLPNFIHTVFSALVLAIALAVACNELGFPYGFNGGILVAASFCWLNEFRYPRYMEKIRATGYGLVLALVSLKGTNLFGYRVLGISFPQNDMFWSRPWFEELLIGAAALYVVWSILQRYKRQPTSRLSLAAITATLFICLVSIKAQGITVGMVIICLGFFGANRVLLGLGILSLLFYISSYYYLLDTTLLDKSISLLITGLALLIVRWVIKNLFPTTEDERNA